ncbi:hypothetical protein T11_4896 [Trichinella zimbabwensis]|uniref:Uncharacterized protein n=1 Tax=Trichinella zimbabwensis TaxID=268475 RepID=A0A0V1HXI5_9BILA|nr:hypothetical protein T11_4896 [Trichinella zimbabwensis]
MALNYEKSLCLVSNIFSFWSYYNTVENVSRKSKNVQRTLCKLILSRNCFTNNNVPAACFLDRLYDVVHDYYYYLSGLFLNPKLVSVGCEFVTYEDGKN